MGFISKHRVVDISSYYHNKMRRNNFISLKNHQTSKENSELKKTSKQLKELRQPISLGHRERKNPYSFHPYLKNNNVKKLTFTEQAIKEPKQNSLLNTTIKNITKLNGSIHIKKKQRFQSIRMHTEKVIGHTEELPLVPDKRKGIRLETLSHQKKLPKQISSGLTEFEIEEMKRYEMYYQGAKRISSLKEFTDENGDVKINIGDSVIYRYEIIKSLGEGSFGKVYKVFDHKKKEFFALKVIRNHPKFNRQAKVEIRILQMVIMNDPKFKSNIVQLKHAFFFRGHACLVFELLNINLYQFLKMFNFSGLKLDLIRRFAIQILKGLLFFKKHDIIHCDLKPQNILLKQQNKTGIKIIDVGSGCFRSEQIYTYIQSRFYRAPQIVLGIPYTSAIDMWSFGCIICQLFIGYPIFPGENEQEQIQMFMEVIGVPTSEVIREGSRSEKFFDGDIPKVKSNTRGRVRRPNSKKLSKILGESNDPDFVNFVESCLVWDPQSRTSAKQALLHYWIVKGLPEEIQKQHVIDIQRLNDLTLT